MNLRAPQPITDPALYAAIHTSKHDTFEMADGIRIGPNSPVRPQEGYRIEQYVGEKTTIHLAVIAASVTREKLFDVFMALVDPLGDDVHVVLETSHTAPGSTHTDHWRHHIDLPVLKSHLYDYEDLLVDDGCTGIAVLHAGQPLEVQFDEHKLLVIYGQQLDAFRRILEECDIHHKSALALVNDGEHIHLTHPKYPEQFEKLRTLLAADAQESGDQYRD